MYLGGQYMNCTKNEKCSKHEQVKRMLVESGINFKEIPIEETMDICMKYCGKIDNEIYLIALSIIYSFYK